jgi:hypothetical protein
MTLQGHADCRALGGINSSCLPRPVLLPPWARVVLTVRSRKFARHKSPSQTVFPRNQPKTGGYVLISLQVMQGLEGVEVETPRPALEMERKQKAGLSVAGDTVCLRSKSLTSL